MASTEGIKTVLEELEELKSPEDKLCITKPNAKPIDEKKKQRKKSKSKSKKKSNFPVLMFPNHPISMPRELLTHEGYMSLLSQPKCKPNTVSMCYPQIPLPPVFQKRPSLVCTLRVHQLAKPRQDRAYLTWKENSHILGARQIESLKNQTLNSNMTSPRVVHKCLRRIKKDERIRRNAHKRSIRLELEKIEQLQRAKMNEAVDEFVNYLKPFLMSDQRYSMDGKLKDLQEKILNVVSNRFFFDPDVVRKREGVVENSLCELVEKITLLVHQFWASMDKNLASTSPIEKNVFETKPEIPEGTQVEDYFLEESETERKASKSTVSTSHHSQDSEVPSQIIESLLSVLLKKINYEDYLGE